jgi:glycosyltransferase involved in cell wall biosynthesis
MRHVLMVVTRFPPSNRVGALRPGRFARKLPEFGWQPVLCIGRESGLDDIVPEWVSTLKPTIVPLAESGRSAPADESDKDGGSGTAASSAPANRSRWTMWPLPQLRQFAQHASQFLQETPDSSVGWARAARVQARALARQQPLDAVYTTGPPHSTHLVALDLKRRFGIPWLADLRDPVSRHPWGARPRNPWGALLKPRYERQIVQNADVVVLNSPGMYDDFVRAHPELPASRFACIPNGCDDEMQQTIQGILADLPPQAPKTRKDPLVLLHPGSLYHGRDPSHVIRAIAQLRQQGWNLRFEQLGDVNPEFKLPRLAADLGIADAVACRGSVPRLEAHRRMAQADLLLLLQPGTPLQIPAKLYEMVLFGKPILAVAPPGSTASIVEQYGLGEVVDNTSPEEIATSLNRLLQRREELETSPSWERARRDFDGTHLTGELAGLLDRISQRRTKE